MHSVIKRVDAPHRAKTAARAISGRRPARMLSAWRQTALLGIILPLAALSGMQTLQAEDSAAKKPAFDMDRKESLQGYLRQYSSLPRPERVISVKGADYVATSEAVIEKAAVFEGKQDVLKWTNGEGWVEYQVDVPEEGTYNLALDWYQLPSKGMYIELGVEIDGRLPFADADSILVRRIWKDDGEIRKDPNGNDILPAQKEAPDWQLSSLKDMQGYYNQNYPFYFTAGKHRVKITLKREALAIASLRLMNEKPLLSYAEKLAEWKAKGAKPVSIKKPLKVQAELTWRKSGNSIVPSYDKSDPATEPFSAAKVKLNTIGGNSNWKMVGDWVEWKVEAPEDGLYRIAFKARQNVQRGMAATRILSVDGVIPYKEARNYEFAYGIYWKLFEMGTKKEPALVYLSKGEHVIRLEAGLGKLSPVLSDVDEYAYQANSLYRRFLMIMGSEPDVYRDYNLDKEIPNLKDTMNNLGVKINKAADDFERITGQKGSEAASLRRAALQLQSFTKKPETIPERLGTFRDNAVGLSGWILQRKEQPVEFDYLVLGAPGRKLPSASTNIFRRWGSDFMSFVASFTEDYTSISGKAGDQKAITVWVGTGRDQAQIIGDLITNYFTPETGIKVNLALVQGGLIEATLAGRGPDIALPVSRGQPVNLAARGALLDVSQFPDYEEVTKRFKPTAMIPYEYLGKTYALPMTQNYHMMFYRKDIFEDLNLQIPQTWNDMYKIIPHLLRNNMKVKLPYLAIDAQGAIDNGLGSRNLYSTLLLQNGGSFYMDGGSRSGLEEPASFAAFKTWTDFYTRYSFDLAADFYTRFRTGEMPLGIEGYGMYNQLSAAAPEIRNLWEMVPIPGIRREDGTIDRTEAGSGSACVIFSKVKNKEEAWRFLEWWTRADIQVAYGTQLETLMGAASRYDTANVEAFDRLPWSTKENRNLKTQWNQLKEIPEMPGSYYLARSVDAAFSRVYNQNANPRETLSFYAKLANEELSRKQKELGLNAK